MMMMINKKSVELSCITSCALYIYFRIVCVCVYLRRCDPSVEWWQGSTFYEIFPASFQDSTKSADGIGDLRGITMRLGYLKELGVRAIRLNSIFPAMHYPEYYSDISSMTDVNRELGTLQDFIVLAREIHKRNMSLVLDLPLYPFMRSSNDEDAPVTSTNETKDHVLRSKRDTANGTIIAEILPSALPISVETIRDVLASLPPPLEKSEEQTPLSSNQPDGSRRQHPVSEAIRIWQQRGVNGFYLKGLERYVNENTFVRSLRHWRSLLRPGNILICHIDALRAATSVTARNAILSRIDLIDVTLRLTNGTKNIKTQIENITKSTLFEKPTYPWIHWSIGGVDVGRVASAMSVRNASIAASLLTMILPGTTNVFYGDEV